MQKRFVGYIDDLTQENLLFMVKANSIPGVKSGFQTYLDPETLLLTIQPGFMILPDGMVVGETTSVEVQLIEPGAGDYWATLIATRLIEPGMLNDEVRYEILQHKLAQDTLSGVSNAVRMPLTWIQKVGNTYLLTDLGNREKEKIDVYSSPFPDIYTLNVDINVDGDFLNRSFRDTDGIFYLRIPEEKNTFISSVKVLAKGGVGSILKVEALKTFENGQGTTLKSNLTFSSTNYQTQSLDYPFRSYASNDILKMQVIGVPAINITTISIVRSRLF